MARVSAAYAVSAIPMAVSVLYVLLDQVQQKGKADPPAETAGEDCAELAELAGWVLEHIESEVADLKRAAATAGWVKP